MIVHHVLGKSVHAASMGAPYCISCGDSLRMPSQDVVRHSEASFLPESCKHCTGTNFSYQHHVFQFISADVCNVLQRVRVRICRHQLLSFFPAMSVKVHQRTRFDKTATCGRKGIDNTWQYFRRRPVSGPIGMSGSVGSNECWPSKSFLTCHRSIANHCKPFLGKALKHAAHHSAPIKF